MHFMYSVRSIEIVCMKSDISLMKMNVLLYVSKSFDRACKPCC